ncbi:MULTISPECIES: DUF4148 domain-containing protein [Burkholderia]|uniref:DUF4148 domain-containing protein n=1 Tax=Burkholderia TaxID=32008 RepID=UPI000422F3BD|nr:MULTISPECIES: DUF4148 domain-containing protein [Burkholderia]
MNKLFVPVVAIAVAVTSIPAFAAAREAVTRAQVRAGLVALQATGYRSSGEDPSYPVKLQAALMKTRMAEAVPADASGYGVRMGAVSESGGRVEPLGHELPIYRGR